MSDWENMIRSGTRDLLTGLAGMGREVATEIKQEVRDYAAEIRGFVEGFVDEIVGGETVSKSDFMDFAAEPTNDFGQNPASRLHGHLATASFRERMAELGCPIRMTEDGRFYMSELRKAVAVLSERDDVDIYGYGPETHRFFVAFVASR